MQIFKIIKVFSLFVRFVKRIKYDIVFLHDTHIHNEVLKKSILIFSSFKFGICKYARKFRCSLQGGNLIPVARSEIQPRGASSLLRGLSLPCALSESYAYLRTYVWNDARKEEARKTSRKAPRANRSNEIMLYYSDFANLY